MASPTTTQRIFRTIDLILSTSDGASFSFLQSELGIPKSSMHSILKELCAQNVLYYSDKTKTYTVGSFFVQLSARCMAQVNLVREINTVARDLCAVAKTTVGASILRDRHIIYVVEHLERAGSRQVNVGLSFPAHTTAMGKVLLSSLSDAEVSDLYQDGNFEIYSENTIKSIDVLLGAIREVRERGYALDLGEFAPSIGCVAVPVILEGKIIAAMSITTNIAWMKEENIQEKLRLLKAASAEATRRMGGIPVF